MADFGMASLQPLGRSAWSRQLNNIDLHTYDLQYTRPKLYGPHNCQIFWQKSSKFQLRSWIIVFGVEHLQTWNLSWPSRPVVLKFFQLCKFFQKTTRFLAFVYKISSWIWKVYTSPFLQNDCNFTTYFKFNKKKRTKIIYIEIYAVSLLEKIVVI